MRRPRPPPVAARGPAPARSCPVPRRAAGTGRAGSGGCPRGPGRRQEPSPDAPPAAPGVSGGSAPPPAGSQPRSPATAATSRSAAAQSPSTRSRGIAMLRFSSIAPAPPSSPCSRRRGRLPPPGQAAATAAGAALRRRPIAGSPGRLRGRSNFWLRRGEPRENPLRGTARIGGVGSGRVGSAPVRSGRRRRAISPCRLGRRAATLRVRPSVRPCPAAAASFRKWRSRAVTARCAPPLTSRHEYA